MAPSAIDIDIHHTTTDHAIDHHDHPTVTVPVNDSAKCDIDILEPTHGADSDVTGFASKALIQKVLKEQIARINLDTCEPGEEDAFYVADLGEVYRQHLRWKLNLARVKPFYGESDPDRHSCTAAQLHSSPPVPPPTSLDPWQPSNMW